MCSPDGYKLIATVNHDFGVPERHLISADPRLGGFLHKFGPCPVRLGKYEGDLFEVLTNAVLAQQISVAAAASVQRKFVAAFGEDGGYPTTKRIAALSPEELRAAGFSRQKAGYVIGLAQAHLPHMSDLEAMSDEEVMERLLPLKGIGRWTIEMLLIFRLGRPDVFPVDDLGVRNGMKIVYDLPQNPTKAQMQELAVPWAPYRSYGAWYMWRAVGFRPDEEVSLSVEPPILLATTRQEATPDGAPR